jgi:ubiquinone/menaquinone biosynthesis C-methylase UbiE
VPSEKDSRPHYSYAAYADPAMAEGFDEARFGGPIGQLLLEDQERVLLAFLGDVAGRRILDLGTGTGRAAMALARRGALVTAVDASSEMLTVARRRTAGAGLLIEFQEGDAQALPFPDRAFDMAVCFRLLMHVPEWQRAIHELCRVAGARVVLDYPSATSSASVQAVWRRIAATLGSAVEAYRVFTHGEIARELKRHGFAITATHRQFVLPIALHKRLGSPRFTQGIEGVLAGAGLLRLVGSPVTIVAERCGS